LSNNTILLAIRPQYAKKIFDGVKTVELRRVRPRQVDKGDLALIYVSSPVKSLAGAFKVDEIIEKPLDELWTIVHKKAGISYEEFQDYFKGTKKGVGIFFTDSWKLPSPIPLDSLRDEWQGFSPPQSFRYPTDMELNSIFSIQSINNISV
jgi:predicted transcriptional regulator